LASNGGYCLLYRTKDATIGEDKEIVFSEKVKSTIINISPEWQFQYLDILSQNQFVSILIFTTVFKHSLVQTREPLECVLINNKALGQSSMYEFVVISINFESNKD